MGAWGMAIFSDDTAADIRDTFTEFIADGLPPDEATNRLIAESADILADEDDSNVFWLALSGTQWKLGRLIDSVRDRAIAVIDSGNDLRRWKDNSKSQINQRKKYLAKLRAQLLSPQPNPKKIKPFPKSTTDFKAGDVVVFRLNAAIAVRFFVYQIWGDRCGSYANICLIGLEDGQPLQPTLGYAELLGPHFTMVSHEPADYITILCRGFPMPEEQEIRRAWSDQPVHGYASTWDKFTSDLPAILKKLGWKSTTSRST